MHVYLTCPEFCKSEWGEWQSASSLWTISHGNLWLVNPDSTHSDGLYLMYHVCLCGNIADIHLSLNLPLSVWISQPTSIISVWANLARRYWGISWFNLNVGTLNCFSKGATLRKLSVQDMQLNQTQVFSSLHSEYHYQLQPSFKNHEIVCDIQIYHHFGSSTNSSVYYFEYVLIANLLASDFSKFA